MDVGDGAMATLPPMLRSESFDTVFTETHMQDPEDGKRPSRAPVIGLILRMGLMR